MIVLGNSVWPKSDKPKVVEAVRHVVVPPPTRHISLPVKMDNLTPGTQAITVREHPGPTLRIHEAAKEPPPKPIEERIYVGKIVTPKYLLQMLEGLTELQAGKLSAIYLGKWMTVKGVVYDVRESYESFAVSITATPGNSLVALYFDKKWVDKITILCPGEKIKGKGEIDTIGSKYIRLSKCEFVD
jgi:hypothetical protein